MRRCGSAEVRKCGEVRRDAEVRKNQMVRRCGGVRRCAVAQKSRGNKMKTKRVQRAERMSNKKMTLIRHVIHMASVRF